MRTISVLFFHLIFLSGLIAQTPMKQIADHPYVEPQLLSIREGILSSGHLTRTGKASFSQPLPSIRMQHEAIKSFTISRSGSFWIDLHANDLWSQRSSLQDVLATLIPGGRSVHARELNWKQLDEQMDDIGMTHIRVHQTFAGHPIHRQDMVLHIKNGSIRDLNGFAWTGKVPSKIPTPLSSIEALEAAKAHLSSSGVKFQPKPSFDGITHPDDEARLVWYPIQGSLVLTYEVSIHPNMMDHWKLFVDATTLEIVEAYSQLCNLAPLHLYDMTRHTSCGHHHPLEMALSEPDGSASPLADGATVINDQDLFGINRPVNAYQVGTTYYMIDASRSGMFMSNQSVMPNDPVGVIWTIDGQNGSPSLPNFELIHVANTNNNWKNLEVSAHYNGGEAYQYFLQTFNRKSINGNGGNIISIINVADDNGNSMDNAFWNGTAMFYGNGDVAFNAPLAKALDVAGHEMSHGVIQNTANLEYVGQSGALNESYADVFGAMIDRDDWKMGEDVTNPAIFPTGALRDLSNPNNGGTQLGDPGWQPKHMSEYQNLPNTPEGDNGGVHINSGIPNRAFYLLATSVGKDKAEQIYYRALTTYLVKSSQFIDMRIAAEKAATDRHGAGSPEVMAVRNAFDAVGIGAGQGGSYEEDIEVNDGTDFILATDVNDSDLYWVPPSNPSQFVKMNVPAPISRPSFTDDGLACVYVDNQQNMILINFNFNPGFTYQAEYLENNPQGIWRNVVVSKDGSKIAYTTANLRNEISVFDFNSSTNFVHTLYNPTSAPGGLTTGDVLYPDAMEWDYSGEYLMYDALNRLATTFGNGIDYWDISFLRAWSHSPNGHGSGQIGKLFSTLPESISVGNPSFAKNSPYIIVFDFLEGYYDVFGQWQTEYRIKAANIEAGQVNDIYLNTTIGYPSYSRLDDKILFTYDNFGSLLLATINLQPSNKTLPVPGTDVILITGAQKGVWYTVGNRIFTSTNEAPGSMSSLKVWPQPASDILNIMAIEQMEFISYEVFDMTGRKVLQDQMSDTHQIRISDLYPGPYMLRLWSQQGQYFVTKFVRQ